MPDWHRAPSKQSPLRDLTADRMGCVPLSRPGSIRGYRSSPARIRIFAFQRKWQVDFPKPLRQILFVQGLNLLQLYSEWIHRHVWEHCDAILLALPIPYQDLPVFEIHILDPQANALHQAYSCTARQSGYQPNLSVQTGQYDSHLRTREHHGQALRLLGPFHVF